MSRMKSNYDVFSQRGDAWDAPVPVRRANLSPDGLVRATLRARTFRLLNPLIKSRAVPHGDQLTVEIPVHGVCMPISQRLAKERNTAIPTERGGICTVPPIAAAARAKMLQRRAARNVKV